MCDSDKGNNEDSRRQQSRPEHERPVELPPPPPPVPKESSLNQVRGGARRVASRAQNYYDSTLAPAFERSGTKEFYDKKVAPTTRNVTQSVKQTVSDQHTRLTSTPMSRTAIVLLSVSVLAIISTFLPMGPTSIGRYGGAARNVLDGNFEDVGGLVLVQLIGVIATFTAATILRLLLFATIVVSIIAIAWRSARAKKIAGLTGVFTGLSGVVIGLAALSVTSSLENMPVGVGSVVLLIFSVAVAASAIILLRSSKSLSVLPPVPPPVPQTR